MGVDHNREALKVSHFTFSAAPLVAASGQTDPGNVIKERGGGVRETLKPTPLTSHIEKVYTF